MSRFTTHPCLERCTLRTRESCTCRFLAVTRQNFLEKSASQRWKILCERRERTSAHARAKGIPAAQKKRQLVSAADGAFGIYPTGMCVTPHRVLFFSLSLSLPLSFSIPRETKRDQSVYTCTRECNCERNSKNHFLVIDCRCC